MGPFREPPPLELGPLAVGLGEAAERAIARLPRGGRLRGRRPGPFAPHTLGALGSAGLVLAAAAAFVSATSAWQPDPWAARGVIAALVLAAGLSLALLMRATDRAALGRIVRGDIVGRAARRTLARISRLAREAEQHPDRFGKRRLRALSRSLKAARDADVGPWIPTDVRGRAELLLARASALHAGPRWWEDDRARAPIETLLRSSAGLLDEPAPARADLLAMCDRAPSRRIAPRVVVPEEAGDATSDAEDEVPRIRAVARL